MKRIGGKLEALTQKMQLGFAPKRWKFRDSCCFFQGFVVLFQEKFKPNTVVPDLVAPPRHVL
jgi:hypothetical protein